MGFLSTNIHITGAPSWTSISSVVFFGDFLGFTRPIAGHVSWHVFRTQELSKARAPVVTDGRETHHAAHLVTGALFCI